MSSKHLKTCFELPTIKICDFEFWLNSVELIISTGLFCDHHKYDYVKHYLEETGYEFLVKDLPKSKDGDKYEGLRTYVLGEINDKFAFDPTVKGIGFFRCRDLKPSAFLDVLNKVYSCEHAIPKFLTRTLFMARLPRRIQKVMFAAILLDSRPLEDISPKDLAAVADGIAAYEKYHFHPRTNKPNITLPKFVPSDPELWFYTLEAAFLENFITDDQLKFEYALDALHSEELLTAALFLTELPNQPAQNKYANLKERVLKTFSLVQNDKTYSFIFRNMKGLRPKSLLQFLKNMVARISRSVAESLIRTFWIMLLPIQTQAVLFQLLIKSREPLQDLDINAMVLVAEGRWRDIESTETMTCILRPESTPQLDSCSINEQGFRSELQAANTFQQKIDLGMKYCDFMYKSYYKNNPLDSIKKCTEFKPEANEVTEAEHHWFEGCTCKYHESYGKLAKNCMRIINNYDEEEYSD